jgi:phosphoribosyl 1,2-cyclic phosphodiesterase
MAINAYFYNLMSLFISSLNSGSNGNCYYIGNQEEGILVDAGISCRETERRMKQTGLSLQTVKAIFISHEHSDHIRGLEILSRKYQLPVYITQPTLINGNLRLEPGLVRNFSAYETIRIGALTITPFPKFHDAADPHSFTVSCAGINIGVFTDIGAPCEHLIGQFRLCHAAFLETNYDEDMLEKGRYPIHLKRRICGGRGHLSNRQALELFLEHRTSDMSHLFLSHLSQDNNRPELVRDLFIRYADGTQIVVASRYEPSAVYAIAGRALQTNAATSVASAASVAPAAHIDAMVSGTKERAPVRTPVIRLPFKLPDTTVRQGSLF